MRISHTLISVLLVLVALFGACYAQTVTLEQSECVQDTAEKCNIDLPAETIVLHEFSYGVSETPGPMKKKTEDAYHAGKYMIAVADGVGGWQKQGIDPSAFSKGLCTSAAAYFERNAVKYMRDPKQLMIDSSKEVKHLGSSTFVIVSIDPNDNKLYTANLGDSGYIILRYQPALNTFEGIFQSQEQQHGFNFPFQLGWGNGDSPHEAYATSHTLEDADLVLVASDGLLDNLTIDQVAGVINEYATQKGPKFDQATLNQVARRLNQRAVVLARDPQYLSPFAKRAAETGQQYMGGKPDDTTVVLAQINFAKSV